jgi:hypothetical protein
VTGSPSGPPRLEPPTLRTWLVTRGALLLGAAIVGAGVANSQGRPPLHGALFVAGMACVAVVLQGIGLLWEARKRRRDQRGDQ